MGVTAKFLEFAFELTPPFLPAQITKVEVREKVQIGELLENIAHSTFGPCI
jgi:hypothetical protein